MLALAQQVRSETGIGARRRFWSLTFLSGLLHTPVKPAHLHQPQPGGEGETIRPLPPYRVSAVFSATSRTVTCPAHSTSLTTFLTASHPTEQIGFGTRWTICHPKGSHHPQPRHAGHACSCDQRACAHGKRRSRRGVRPEDFLPPAPQCGKAPPACWTALDEVTHPTNRPRDAERPG